MIIYVPSVSGNGKTCDGIVELVDILPTICDLWGTEKSPKLEGTSLLPLLNNPNQAWKKAAFISIPEPGGRGVALAVRTKQYKYAVYRPNNNPEFELYDLENDPFEHINVVDDPDYKKVRDQMAGLLKKGYRAALPE